MKILEELQNPERFKHSVYSESMLERAISRVLSKIDVQLERFGDKFPENSTKDGIYQIQSGNTDWTEGFWTGMLWLAYELTGQVKYREVAEVHVVSFAERAEKRIGTNTHDLGFLYSLSCVSAYKLTGNLVAKEAALTAAKLLMERYIPQAGIVQAWGDMNNPEERGRMILDCNLNLPLLYWASEVSGEEHYREAAERHIEQAAKWLVRDDFSTYHTYFMDVNTGEALRGTTHQGYSDSSCWSRGQGWGMYGFLLNYLYTGNLELVELSRNLTHYFLNHLPEDLVAYWDLVFTEGTEQERDSSASAVAACALLELVKHTDSDDPYRQIYRNAAYSMLLSLEENYRTADGASEEGMLRHAVYNKPRKMGIDEAVLWGDYFYLEALVRLKKDWGLYW